MSNQRGIIDPFTLLAIVTIIGAVLFIPNNPVGNVLGVTQKPNKIVQTEKVELIKDKDGVPIAYKTTTSDKDLQQKVGILEQVRALPVFILILSFAGIFFPFVSLWLHNTKQALISDTKKIVVSIDKAMSKVKDDTLKAQLYDEMAKTQDETTKDLVDKIQGK